MLWFTGILLAAISLGILILVIWMILNSSDSYYGDPILAVIALFIVAPIAIGFIYILWDSWYDYYFREQQYYNLNQKDWVCSASHSVSSTTYVKSGSVMIPVITYNTVCDQYNHN